MGNWFWCCYLRQLFISLEIKLELLDIALTFHGIHEKKKNTTRVSLVVFVYLAMLGSSANLLM